MSILSMKLCILPLFVFLMFNGTLQEEAEELGISIEEKPSICNSEEKQINGKLDAMESDKQPLENKYLSKEENGEEKVKIEEENLKPGESELNKKDTQMPIQLEDNELQKFGRVFLLKLDGELKKKIQNKIEDEKLSIDPSLFEEFTNDEKEELQKAMSEAFSSLLAKLVEQFATGEIPQDVFSISPSAVSNLFLEQNKDEVTLEKKDEL